jgi:hypothetical protein
LCDEPTGALDFATGLQVLRLLKKITSLPENGHYHYPQQRHRGPGRPGFFT